MSAAIAIAMHCLCQSYGTLCQDTTTPHQCITKPKATVQPFSGMERLQGDKARQDSQTLQFTLVISEFACPRNALRGYRPTALINRAPLENPIFIKGPLAKHGACFACDLFRNLLLPYKVR